QQKWRAIQVLKVRAVSAHSHGAMLSKAALSNSRSTQESTSLLVQARIVTIRAESSECPASNLVRGKPHSPGTPPIPESIHLARVARGSSKHDPQRGF